MALRRFLENKETGDDDEFRTLLENYGLTVYRAQMFERQLAMVVLLAKTAGWLPLASDEKGVQTAEELLDECLGPAIKALEKGGLMNAGLRRLLKKANAQRNYLVHDFLAENGVEIVTSAGRRSVNDALWRLYCGIMRATEAANKITDHLFEQLGCAKGWADARVEQLKRELQQPPNDFCDDAPNA